MTDLVTLLFATHHPGWASIQALLNILLTGDERRLVLDELNEEAQRLHQENPDGDPDLTKAIPLAEPNWDFNEIGLPLLVHYERCILEGLKKRHPYAEKLECGTGSTRKPTEDPSEFLEGIFRTYRKYADLDPETPENIRMVNMTFLSQCAPGIRKKLQKLEGGIGLNLSQVVDIAFKIYNNRERKEAEVSNILGKGFRAIPLEGTWHATPSKMLATGQCAYCKGKGHWKMSAPSEGKGSQNLRTGEICWGKEIAPMMSDRAWRFNYYNSLLKLTRHPPSPPPNLG